ncbi:MAG TPA: SMP-30/gluconolactonase/LRE family protein [Geobacteraceae bacterium]
MKASTLTIRFRLLALAMLAPLALLTACGSGGGGSTSTSVGAFLGSSNNVVISTITSTVPANGDVNPYGVAIVENQVGNLKTGHVLVSNFNNSSNLQGTGSTIVDVDPAKGTLGLFAQIGADTCQKGEGVGLTTALVALKAGWVVVGSLPTKDGTSATATSPGCLVVLDSMGNVAETITDPLINGPWDMTAFEDANGAKLFVTNVLNGTVAANGAVVNGGTVIRVDMAFHNGGNPTVSPITKIGDGFPERTDPAALVIGPTGLGLSPDNSVLYVADSLNNRIAMIANPLTTSVSAGTGTTLTAGRSLNDPLGLAVDSAGNVFTVNGNDGFLLVFDTTGKQLAKKLLDKTAAAHSLPGAGTLFGLAIAPQPQGGVYFVDDGTNTLNFLH